MKDGLEHLADAALSHSPVLTAMLADLHARLSALETAAIKPPEPVPPAQEHEQTEQAPVQ